DLHWADNESLDFLSSLAQVEADGRQQLRYQAYPILKSTARLPSLPTANSRLATMPWAGLSTYCTPAPTLGKKSDFEQPLRSPPYRHAMPPNAVAVQRSANRWRSSTSIDDIDLPRYSPIV